MPRLPILLAVGLALAATSSPLAAHATVPYIIPVPVAPTPRLVAGDQFYPATLAGMSRYLDSLSAGRPDVAASVRADVDELYARQRTAMWLGLGGIPVGLALLAGSLYVASLESLSEDAQTNLMLGGLTLGLLTPVAGLVSYFVMTPKQGDLMEVVNRHNQLLPSHPLRYGALPPRRFGVRAALLRF